MHHLRNLILILLLAALPLTACATDTPGPTDSTTAPPAVTEAPAPVAIELNAADAPYTIVRAENAEQGVIELAMQVRKTIAGTEGASPVRISDDWARDLEEAAANTNPEILVGLTNRPASIEAAEALPTYYDYSITVKGNKIAIHANTLERLTEAVERFLAGLTDEGGRIFYDGSNYLDSYTDYALPNMTLFGTSLRDYVIVVPKQTGTNEKRMAETLRDDLITRAGQQLDIVTDDAAPTAHEILIGATNRAESASLTGGGRLMSANGKLVLNAESGAYYSLLRTELLGQLEAVGGQLKADLDYTPTETPEMLFYTQNFAADIIDSSLNPGVVALLSCCEYYADALQQGIKKGEKWVYSNSSDYVPQRGYFDDMLKSNKRGANCASPPNWAFIDMAIMPGSQRFYGGSTGNFANYSKVIEYLEPVCEIIDYSATKPTFKTLYNQGKVKTGDIFLCVHHTFVYRGQESFYAAGHDGAWHTDPTARTEDERKAVFDSWILGMDECTNTNYKVYYIVRLKDDYVPKYYRDTTGQLVSNPMLET